MCGRFCAILIYFGVIASTRANPDCSRPPPFVNPHQCCHEPKPDDASIKCAQALGFPLPTEKSTQRWQPPNLQAAACFADCILNQSNYLSNGEIQMDAVTSDVQQRFADDPDYIPVILAAFERCIPIAKEKMAAVQNMPLASTVLTPCSPFGGLLFGCIYMEYFTNCPASKWTSSTECEALREHIRTCSKRGHPSFQPSN